MSIVGQKVMNDLRLQVFSHLQRMPVAYFDRNPVGRLTTRVTNDIEALSGLFTSGVGPIGLLSLAGHLNLRPRYVDSQSIGGSSFVSHCLHAAAAIAAGLCEVALVTYGSTAASERFAIGTGGGSMIDPPDAFEAPYGPTIVGSYALVAQRHMHEYGTTSEQLAEVAVATRKWAALNPRAMMRDPLCVEDVLASRMISWPLHLLDCCLVTDAGGAVVVTSAERARALRKPPIWVLGTGEASTHVMVSQMPSFARWEAAEIAGAEAFAAAGVRHADVDVALFYDAFTIVPIMGLEALGFCKRGEGGAFVSGQRTAPGGDFPMNTNGGGLSYQHTGMYGMFILIEAVRQLRGECGPRQVPDCRLVLCHGLGGMFSAAATLVLSSEPSS